MEKKLVAKNIDEKITQYEKVYDDTESFSDEKISEMGIEIDLLLSDFYELFGQTYDDYKIETTPMFLNVYYVTRHYGGAEEGGWWYDWHECVEVYPVRNAEKGLELKEWLFNEHKENKHGNISSVLGGQDVVVLLQKTPKESETKERPCYE